MRKFEEEYKESEFVQEALAQITGYDNITLWLILLKATIMEV